MQANPHPIKPALKNEGIRLIFGLDQPEQRVMSGILAQHLDKLAMATQVLTIGQAPSISNRRIQV